jgi:hypothetical protein
MERSNPARNPFGKLPKIQSNRAIGFRPSVVGPYYQPSPTLRLLAPASATATAYES